MDNIFNDVFSEYTVVGVAFKPKGADAYTLVDGAGTASEEFERKVVTKAKSNVVVKRISRAAGSGTLTISLHMPMDLYNTLQGMLKAAAGGVISGVSALPGRAKIPEVEIAMEVEDEDGDTKFKYYPKASSSAFSRSVDSEADTVAEVEMTFDLSVDAYDNIMYESLKDDLPTTGDLTKSNWMSVVSSELLQAEGSTGGTTGGTTGGSTGTTA